MINFVSPLTVAFAVILLGYAIGKIRFCNISLDLSAILLVAITLGFVISKFDPSITDANFNDTMSAYSRLGTSLFVSVIGIMSGFSLKLSSKRTVLYLFIGCLAVLVGFVVGLLIGYIDSDTDKSLLLGILSGALTSTPGLAVISERQDLVAEISAIGYGVAYILGVVIVVIVAQLSGRFTPQKERFKREVRAVTVTDGTLGILLITLCALIGEIIGKLSLFGCSLGTTGATLICGIAVGCIIRKSHIGCNVEHSFPIYRNLGLMLFFVGNGVIAGTRLNSGISIKWFILGAVMTLSSVMAVWLVCKILRLDICSLMAGAMTSTPALGVLVKKGYAVDLTAYSISYIGALLTMTVGIKFI